MSERIIVHCENNRLVMEQRPYKEDSEMETSIRQIFSMDPITRYNTAEITT